MILLLQSASDCGLDDPADEFKLRGYEVCVTVQKLVAAFEAAEGKRRALEKRQQ